MAKKFPIDILDGLPVGEEVGDWALEKHERLRRYIEIARGARSKYLGASNPDAYRGGATYIDLFSGPGRSRIRGTGEIIDGSPLVAFKAAASGMAPFSEIHLADVEPEFSAAAAQRIVNAGGTAFAYAGPAEKTAKEIVSRLNPHGLHLAFLDPFNLADLSFEVIRTLAAVKHVDFLMHVSVQDLQRNTDRYTAEEAKAFDQFAPGWRATVSTEQNLISIRAAVLNHWRSLVHGLGFMEIRTADLVRGNRNQRLYWLVFASRHPIANAFWEKIRHIVTGQGSLGL